MTETPPDTPDESKLTRTKQRWSEEGRFLTGRKLRKGEERLPPGQHLVRDWPVLDLGVQPDVKLDIWRLRLFGLVEEAVTLDWAGFQALPQRDIRSDMHCVTTWSRYDNTWHGVATRDLMAQVRPLAAAKFVVLQSFDGYTTNLPLDDFATEDVLLATHWEGKPLTREHGGPVRVIVPHLYPGKARSGCGGSSSWTPTVRATGRTAAITCAANHGRKNAMGKALLPGFAAALFLVVQPARAYDPAPVPGAHGMVVSAQQLASEVGVEVLQAGGNAVDAAVAVGYALAVVYPAAGNLGGGGFMTLRLADGTARFLDFREKAPMAASATMFLDDAGALVKGRSTDTWLAVGVPGSIAGLEAARARWGRLSRDAVMAPAIRLARDGLLLGPGDVPLFNVSAKGLARDPAAAAIFLRDGQAPHVGDRLVQADLAATLEQLMRDGPDAFYRGPLGDKLVAASTAGGGIFTKADLEHYAVREMAPVSCGYRGYQVLSAPPPSSGGVALCEMLVILEGYDLRALGFHSAAAVHVMVEAMRQAFADRNRLGDPDFVRNPVAELIDPAYAAAVRARILPERATPSDTVLLPPAEGSNTTHYAVVDADGNAVAVTYTLNDWFGVKKVVPGTGIILNNEMDDFTAQPGKPNMFGLVQGAANAVGAGKTPLSSMAPTIVVKDGKTAMVLGSPGGPRIITTVLNLLLNVIDYGMTAQEAVDAPRIHHQWLPDTLFVERFALSPDTRALLEAQGYKVVDGAPWGIAEAVLIGAPRFGPAPPSSGSQSLTLGDPAALGAKLFGAHDPRGGAGAAVGY